MSGHTATPNHAPVDLMRHVSLAALANRVDLLKPIWTKIPDGAEIQKFVITVSEQDRNRISVALNSLADLVKALEEISRLVCGPVSAAADLATAALATLTARKVG